MVTKKRRFAQLRWWAGAIAFVAVALVVDDLVAEETAPPWQIVCWSLFLPVMIVQFDCLALLAHARLGTNSQSSGAGEVQGRLGEHFVRWWPFPLVPAVALSLIFSVAFALRWGVALMGYCAVPFSVYFCAMAGAHVCLIRVMRDVPAAASAPGARGFVSGRRKHLFFHYSLVCLSGLAGIAFFWAVGRPWKLKGMLRSASVPASFGLVGAFLAYRAGRTLISAAFPGEEVPSVQR